MTKDIPHLTETQIRGLFYIKEINMELNQEEAATISQLSSQSDWNSSYFTNIWQDLAPELVQRQEDGRNTRLTLTNHGLKAVTLYEDLNHVFAEAGI